MDDGTLTGRLLVIVDAVAQCGDGISLAELTRRTGIPKSSVRRIANDLVGRGVLFHGSAGYRLGFALAHLGYRAFSQNGLRDAAMPYLQDLFDRTRQIVWVAALDRGDVVQVDAHVGHSFARYAAFPARAPVHRSPLVNTALGRVVLSARPDLAELALSRPLDRLTPRTVVHPRGVSQSLSRIRDTGYAIERGESAVGWSCIAVPIWAPDRTLVGVLGVTGHSATFRPERMVAHTAAASHAVGQSMFGWKASASWADAPVLVPGAGAGRQARRSVGGLDHAVRTLSAAVTKSSGN